MRRSIAIVATAGAVAAFAWALWPKPILVDAVRLHRGVFEDTVDDDGRTRVRNRYVLSAPIGGRVQRITLRAGDTVDRDEVVATIRPVAPPLRDARMTSELTERVGAAEAALAQARATLAKTVAARDQSRVEHDRASKLATTGAVSVEELERARLAFHVAERDLAAADAAAHTAEHDLASARAALAQMREGGDEPFAVTAPIAGRIFRVLEENAAVVAPGTPLLEMADPTDLEIVVDVLTTDAVRIASGAPVVVDHWGGDGPLDGRVRLVEPSGFTKLSALGVEEQRTNVLIDLTSPADDWRALGDGFRVDAHIVAYRADDVLTVPASALFRDSGGWAAFVVDAGRARKRRVVAARRTPTAALVDGGLAEGDVVVLYPTDAIDDGVRVAPTSREAPG